MAEERGWCSTGRQLLQVTPRSALCYCEFWGQLNVTFSRHGECFAPLRGANCQGADGSIDGDIFLVNFVKFPSKTVTWWLKSLFCGIKCLFWDVLELQSSYRHEILIKLTVSMCTFASWSQICDSWYPFGAYLKILNFRPIKNCILSVKARALSSNIFL